MKNIIKQYVKEALVSASAEHVKKEVIRERVQSLITQMILDGSISSQEQLDDTFKTIDMAMRALKSVPFEVFQKLAK